MLLDIRDFKLELYIIDQLVYYTLYLTIKSIYIYIETVIRKCGRCHNKLDLSYYTEDMKSFDKCSIYVRDHNNMI